MSVTCIHTLQIGKFTTLDVILEDHMYDIFGIITACTPNDQWADISEEKGELLNVAGMEISNSHSYACA